MTTSALFALMFDTGNVTRSQPREDGAMSTQKPAADVASRRDFLISGAAVVAAAGCRGRLRGPATRSSCRACWRDTKPSWTASRHSPRRTSPKSSRSSTCQPSLRSGAQGTTETVTGTPAAVTVSLLTRMLIEAFEGPPGPWTYFTDASPGTGIFATIRGLSAVQASERRGPGHSTLGVALGAIAHAAYHLGAIWQRLAPRHAPGVP